MTDCETIIKAWNLCKYDPDPGMMSKYMHSCVECPYYETDGTLEECPWEECHFGKLINDTTEALQTVTTQNKNKELYIKDLIAQIKRLENARLITVSDFTDADEDGYIPCWQEYRKSSHDASVLLADCICKSTFLEADPYLLRWWTKRPTGQQMKNMPWKKRVHEFVTATTP